MCWARPRNDPLYDPCNPRKSSHKANIFSADLSLLKLSPSFYLLTCTNERLVQYFMALHLFWYNKMIFEFIRIFCTANQFELHCNFFICFFCVQLVHLCRMPISTCHARRKTFACAITFVTPPSVKFDTIS